MTKRVVYDTMVFLSATATARPWERELLNAARTGLVELFMSAELLAEIRDVLNRPAIWEKWRQAPRWRAMTGEQQDLAIGFHVSRFLDELERLCTWREDVPERISLEVHPKDDHLYNLAIEGSCPFLVTAEKRHLEIETRHPDFAAKLRTLAPELRVVHPLELIRILGLGSSKPS